MKMIQSAASFRGMNGNYFNNYANQQFNVSNYGNSNNSNGYYSSGGGLNNSFTTTNSYNSNSNSGNTNSGNSSISSSYISSSSSSGSNSVNNSINSYANSNYDSSSYDTSLNNNYSNSSPLHHHSTNTVAANTGLNSSYNPSSYFAGNYYNYPKNWGHTSVPLKPWDQAPLIKPWEQTSLNTKPWDQMSLSVKPWDQTALSTKTWGQSSLPTRPWEQTPLSSKTWDQGASLSAKSYFLSAYEESKAAGISLRREATIGAYHEQYQYHTYGQPHPYHSFESSTLYLQRFASLPGPGKQKRPRMSVQKRLLVNARERDRMRVLNKAFESLRDALPCYISDGHMAKITTLKLAINYISALTELLNEDAKKDKNGKGASEGAAPGHVFASVLKNTSSQNKPGAAEDEDIKPNICKNVETNQ